MVKRIELCESYIVPKGLLGYYITILFWIFEEKTIKPFVHCYIRCIRDIIYIFLLNEQLKDIYTLMLKADFAH